MAGSDDTLKKIVHDHVLQFLKHVIVQSEPRTKSDEVARALLFFLVRVSNTWRSIRTLHECIPDDHGPMLDAGALLRAMFDAYLQAAYIVSDQKAAAERARDYFDFEHVERHRRVRTVLTYDNPLAEMLRSSPRRPEGEKRVHHEYDRVKAKYTSGKLRADGTVDPKARVRLNWYPGTLADVARSLGKSDEYDIFLAAFHGCVHSSALAVRNGPVVSREHIVDWASTIAARVARLNIEHNRIQLNELHTQILAVLSQSLF